MNTKVNKYDCDKNHNEIEAPVMVYESLNRVLNCLEGDIWKYYKINY